jgi:predicted phosphate transport protein (TIGR00153 family)
MFSIIPREEKYFELFNEMAALINVAGQKLATLFDDIENAVRYAQELQTIEHQCDELTHDVLRRLNKSFITPIDREDIHALIITLDTVVDLMEGTAARIIMYGVKEATPAMRELARLLVETAASLGRSVAMLNSNDGMLDSLVEVHHLESQGDAIYRKAMTELFAESTDALGILKCKEIYEKLESAIDACEGAANVLENITLKNA